MSRTHDASFAVEGGRRAPNCRFGSLRHSATLANRTTAINAALPNC